MLLGCLKFQLVQFSDLLCMNFLNKIITHATCFGYSTIIIIFTPICEKSSLMTSSSKVDSEIKNTIKYEKLHGDLNEWKRNGINTLHYKILNKTILLK